MHAPAGKKKVSRAQLTAFGEGETGRKGSHILSVGLVKYL